MIDFDDLWLQPMEGFNEKNKGRTEEQILAREAKIGFKLPHSYREMMKVQNGGLLNKAMYSFEGTTMELYFSGFDEILDETAGYNTLEDVFKEYLSDEDISKLANSDICIPSRLPILSHMDGHCYLCFDYGWLQETPITEPGICLFDLEGGFTESLRIKNFDTLINNLYYAGYSAQSFQIGINANLEIEEIVQIISGKLQLTFMDNTGYKYARESSFDKWYCSLSPNMSLRFDITPNQYKLGTYLFQNLKNINCILKISCQSAGLMPETTMIYIEDLIYKIEVLKPIIILKPLIIK